MLKTGIKPWQVELNKEKIFRNVGYFEKGEVKSIKNY